MKHYDGKVLFLEDGSKEAVPAGIKFLICKGEFANKDLQTAGLLGFISSSFSSEVKANLNNSSILTIEIDKKSIEDMYHTFSDKDTECSIVLKDDDTTKIKLISGSLSKSYIFKLNDIERSILNDESWIGNKK